MKTKILEVLRSKMIEYEIDGIDVLIIDETNLDLLAKELNALFALREVVKSVKEKEEITFQDWANIKGYYKTENGWFNENGTQRLTTELIDMYFAEHPL